MAQDMTVVGPGLNGQVLDVLGGDGDTRGNEVQLGEDEGPQGAQRQDGVRGDSCDTEAHRLDVLGEIGIALRGLQRMGQWDANNVGAVAGCVGEVEGHWGCELD